MVWLLTIVAAAVIGISSAYWWKPDNIVEEVAEVVIEKELDLPKGSVDLTPKDWFHEKSNH